MLKTLIKLPRRFRRYLDDDIYLDEKESDNEHKFDYRAYLDKEKWDFYWMRKKHHYDKLEKIVEKKSNLIKPDNIYTAFIDGASKGNPGHSSCGFLIKDENFEIILKDNFYLGFQTNNQAEYFGLFYLLFYANSIGIKDLDVYADSQLVVNQMNGIYKVRNDDLFKKWKKCKELSRVFENFSCNFIERTKNKEADALCNRIFRF